MTDTFKVLGQSFPAAATVTTLYTVPALTSTVISTIMICNQSTTLADTVSILIRVAGAAVTSKQYLLFLNPMNATDSYTMTLGISLATTDIISCFSTNGTCSFNAFGVEVT